MDISKIIDELNLILIELDARDSCGNLVVESLFSETWDGLCDMGQDLFQKLKSNP